MLFSRIINKLGKCVNIQVVVFAIHIKPVELEKTKAEWEKWEKDLMK